MVITSCPLTQNILVSTYDGKYRVLNVILLGHFVIVKLSLDLAIPKFEILQDISDLRENNAYRYIRHATILN